MTTFNILLLRPIIINFKLLIPLDRVEIDRMQHQPLSASSWLGPVSCKTSTVDKPHLCTTLQVDLKQGDWLDM